jgi:NADP-dependent 3-hydroxy acid dehydrogenase YdfG
MDLMTNLRSMRPQRDHDVVLIVNADCDAGHRRALDELAAGNDVAVTAPLATALVRILLHASTSHVYAIACDVTDPHQYDQLLHRVSARFGCPDRVVDGRNGASTSHADGRAKAS